MEENSGYLDECVYSTVIQLTHKAIITDLLPPISCI